MTITPARLASPLLSSVMACVLWVASGLSLAETSLPDNGVGLLVKQYCSACHGLRGDETAGPHFPYLASQQYDYLVKQLRDFQSGNRNNPIMATYARLIPPQDIPALASYFSKQTLARAPAKADELSTRGEVIFKQGIGGGTVPACQVCHGANGEGRDGVFPRIAGQRSAYLANQLRNFKAQERTNDPSALMRQIATRMSEDDIEAVAAYLSGRP